MLRSNSFKRILFKSNRMLFGFNFSFFEKNPFYFNYSTLNKDKEFIFKKKSNEQKENKIHIQFDDNTKHDITKEEEIIDTKKQITTKDKKGNENKIKIESDKIIISEEKLKKQIFNEKEIILIYSQETGKKYYLYNIIFLSSYSIYSWICIFQQISEPLYTTILIFGFISHLMLIGCIMLSNRHIKTIYTNKTGNKFLIKNFELFGLYEKSFILDVGNIKEVKSNNFLRKMNLYYLKFGDKIKLFRVFNILIFRPNKTTQMFDKIFKSKLVKNKIEKNIRLK